MTISFVEGVYRICIQKIKRDCLQEDIQTLAETDMPQSCGDNAVLKCVLVGDTELISITTAASYASKRNCCGIQSGGCLLCVLVTRS